MQSNITDGIISYMNDQDGPTQFAISLYGEWGSGKTYFCENVLHPALKEAGYNMVRVSLFGVSSYGEIYNRMLSALCHVDGPKIQGLAKTAGKGLFSALDGYLGAKGIKLDINAETVMSAMSMKRTLFVLDDTERSKFPGGIDDLLGLVNDMTENHQWHVLLIRNKPFNLASNESEKVVSRQFEYLPTSEDLYNAIVTASTPPDLDFSIREAIISGMEASKKLNARALARIMPTVRQMIDSEIMHSKNIAPDGRKHAFSDVVKFSLSVASGDIPSKPKRTKKEGGQHIDMSFILASMEWDRYQLLARIAEPIGQGKLASKEAIEECLAAYIKKEYPESPADMEIKNLCNGMRNIEIMDDPEVSKLASGLAEAMARHEFSCAWLYRAWTMNQSLRNLGFEEALSAADAKECYREKAKERPDTVYAYLHEEYSMWVGTEGTNYDPNLEEVIEYAKALVESSLDKAKNSYSVEQIDESSGVNLAKEMEKRLDSSLPLITSISPCYISECFFRGNGRSQYQLHRFFRGVLGTRFGRIEDQDALFAWLGKIQEELEGRDAESNTGRMRQRWLKSDIEDIRKSIGSLGRVPSPEDNTETISAQATLDASQEQTGIQPRANNVPES